MTATFLVEVEIADVSTLTALAEDIQDACEGAAIPVTSVKPWQRPSLPTNPATAYPVPPPAPEL